MNKRLETIKLHIPSGTGVIDVGTDHGYLPVALAESGYKGSITASDIRPGPLEAARKTARAAGMEHRIRFTLCDGLDGCDPESIDVIVIAGMGGDNICGILDRAEWCMDPRYTLILQPMTRAEVLRYWLIYNGFAITSEDPVEDGGHLYSIIVARFGAETQLSDAELFTGSFDMLKDHPLFPGILSGQRNRFERMLNGLETAERPESAARTAILRKILREIKEMQTDALNG